MAANINKRESNKGNMALYIILFIILLALNGVLNFIVANFVWDTILTASYWLKTIAGAGSGLGAFILFAFMRRDSVVLNDENYNEDVDELNAIIREKIDNDFSDYIAYENREMKKLKWREKYQNKRTKWTDKVPARVLGDIKIIKEDRWSFQIPKWRILKRIWYLRRKNKALKWQRKLELIEEKLDEQWIDENIDYRKVKYPDITPSEVLTGERNSSNNKIIDNSALKHIIKDRVPLIVVTTGAQAFYHALNIVQAVNPAGIMMGIAVQLTTIFVNAGVGHTYGKTLFKKVDSTNLFIRKTYVMGYIKWKKSKR